MGARCLDYPRLMDNQRLVGCLSSRHAPDSSLQTRPRIAPPSQSMAASGLIHSSVLPRRGGEGDSALRVVARGLVIPASVPS